METYGNYHWEVTSTMIPKRGILLRTFRSRERRLNHSTTARRFKSPWLQLQLQSSSTVSIPRSQENCPSSYWRRKKPFSDILQQALGKLWKGSSNVWEKEKEKEKLLLRLWEIENVKWSGEIYVYVWSKHGIAHYYLCVWTYEIYNNLIAPAGRGGSRSPGGF